MKKTSVLLGITLLFIGISCKKDTENTVQAEVKKYDVTDFFDTKSVSGAGFNANETKVLISSNSSGIFNSYEVTIADTVAKALTNSTKESVFAEGYIPGSSNFIYSSKNSFKFDFLLFAERFATNLFNEKI